MKLIQAEIKAGTSNVKLVCTPRWLLSPTAMVTTIVDLEKRSISIKIRVTNIEDRDSILKKGI